MDIIVNSVSSSGCFILVTLLVVISTHSANLQAPSDWSIENSTIFMEAEYDDEDNDLNMTILPIIEEGVLKMNISWTQHFNVKSIEFWDLTCGSKFPYSRTQDMIPSIIVPEINHMFEFKPSCSYLVFASGKNSHGMPFKREYNQTIPDCVGEICNCTKFQPKQNEFEVEQASNEEFLISWEYPPIRNIGIFTMHFQIANGTYHVPTDYISLSTLNSTIGDLWAGKKMLDIPEDVYSEGHNELRVEMMTNKSNCEFHYDVVFSATKELESNKLMFSIYIIMAVLVFFVGIAFYRRRVKTMKDRISFENYRNCENAYIPVPTISRKQEKLNELYVPQESLTDDADLFEFPSSRLDLMDGRIIGSGAFGEVLMGRALRIQGTQGYSIVAVKRLRPSAPPEDVDDFICEINILKRIPNHQHIVSLFGCCTKREPYMMIMEFVPCGDLRKYLLQLRAEWHASQERMKAGSPMSSDCTYISQPTTSANWFQNYNSKQTSTSTEMTDVPSVTTGYTTCPSASYAKSSTYVPAPLNLLLDHTELQSFALQIARGMEHLEKIAITHRDLAARNILISEHKVLKISDFGLSRSGPYVNRNLKKIPLRWNAIEAIDSQFYDSKSDVWSYGVVLWEIGTLGAFPYERISDNLLLHSLLNGYRLERPEVCSDDLYTVMLRCWSKDPNLRPSFAELVDLLDVHKADNARSVYIDFMNIKSDYAFPPIKVRRDH